MKISPKIQTILNIVSEGNYVTDKELTQLSKVAEGKDFGKCSQHPKYAINSYAYKIVNEYDKITGEFTRHLFKVTRLTCNKCGKNIRNISKFGE